MVSLRSCSEHMFSMCSIYFYTWLSGSTTYTLMSIYPIIHFFLKWFATHMRYQFSQLH